ncbi:hypothetical protein GCM10009767_35720 [Kocuria aegyptia]|uniref:Uncharacterized protein n=1 Tax=Kocuria aegyptia TaxID=330943 RepID=A0ABP4XAT2_9MICC
MTHHLRDDKSDPCASSAKTRTRAATPQNVQEGPAMPIPHLAGRPRRTPEHPDWWNAYPSDKDR